MRAVAEDTVCVGTILLIGCDVDCACGVASEIMSKRKLLDHDIPCIVVGRRRAGGRRGPSLRVFRPRRAPMVFESSFSHGPGLFHQHKAQSQSRGVSQRLVFLAIDACSLRIRHRPAASQACEAWRLGRPLERGRRQRLVERRRRRRLVRNGREFVLLEERCLRAPGRGGGEAAVSDLHRRQ